MFYVRHNNKTVASTTKHDWAILLAEKSIDQSRQYDGGFSVTLTADNHIMMHHDGWKGLCEFRVGQYIEIRNPDLWHPTYRVLQGVLVRIVDIYRDKDNADDIVIALVVPSGARVIMPLSELRDDIRQGNMVAT